MNRHGETRYKTIIDKLFHFVGILKTKESIGGRPANRIYNHVVGFFFSISWREIDETNLINSHRRVKSGNRDEMVYRLSDF